MNVSIARAEAVTSTVQMMPPEEVGPVVVRAVRANRLHVLTHPQSRPFVEQRFRSLLDDYAFAEAAAGDW